MEHQHTELHKRPLFAYFNATLPGDGLARYQSPGLPIVMCAIVVAELLPPPYIPLAPTSTEVEINIPYKKIFAE